MKWYFFYTPNYGFYKNHLLERLSNTFDTVPLEVQPLKLSTTGHHFTNLTLKIELVINAIKENMNSHIVFSDATIFVGDRVGELNNYLNQKCLGGDDIVFAQQNNRNIGFMLIHCTDKMLNFWEECLNIMNKSLEEGKDVHDQCTVNDMLNSGNYPINWSYFEQNRVWCSNELPEHLKPDFYIFKMTVRLDIGICRHRQRLTALYYAKLISESDYWNNVDLK